ncbi:protein kinase [Candidatus Synechococcus calcipolaris G9]|uniref:Protein kinase n=1 Tax=Candidatus Synechococcus calcipolaris G9 TaxID=1497997 RepID=A0ABT6EZ41_9SYNE|nr:protein kinase [Candidatus Synechococcus calcipolaris]MDG2990575.1 protein kinase [Candidatus Synechococcus calcipolaris G9]
MNSYCDAVSAGTLLYDFLIGETIENKYFLEELIAEDHSSALYSATVFLQSQPIATRAIKLMPVHTYPGQERIQLKELQMGLSLQHPNLISYNTIGKYSLSLHNYCCDFYYADIPFTDYDLQDHFEYNHTLDRQDILTIITDVAKALEFLHKKSLTHGNLQPENIRWCEQEQIWKVAHVGLDDDPSGMLVYLAPEAFTRCQKLGPKADIWALGILTYLLLTGEVPYGATTEVGVIDDISHCRLTLPEILPAPFDALIRGCLAENIQDRWTAQEVLAAVEHQAGSAYPISA